MFSLAHTRTALVDEHEILGMDRTEGHEHAASTTSTVSLGPWALSTTAGRPSGSVIVSPRRGQGGAIAVSAQCTK